MSRQETARASTYKKSVEVVYIMGTSPTWQSVLQTVLKIAGERQRLASALGLSQMTLTRWANGNTRPQKPHLIGLIQYFHPQYRQKFLDALAQSYPDIQSWIHEEKPELVPAQCFAQVLTLRSTLTSSSHFWKISEYVLEEALKELDPNKLGMAITIAQCMPPSPARGNKIRALRERTGKGTPPWAADLEHLTLFLGMESLAGYAVEQCHIVSVDDLGKDKHLPAYQTEFEVSAAAYPIMFGGRVAGCLLASSTQAGYFSQQRLAILTAFSDLIALAFTKDEFYDRKLVELRPLPEPEKQRPLIASFRQRILHTHIGSRGSHVRPTNAETELQIWSDIEEDILRLADAEAQQAD